MATSLMSDLHRTHGNDPSNYQLVTFSYSSFLLAVRYAAKPTKRCRRGCLKPKVSGAIAVSILKSA